MRRAVSQGSTAEASSAFIISRMTITIDADVLAKLEEKAKSESRDVDAVANELLRQALEEKLYKLELEGWPAKLRPGVDLTDRDKLYEMMDDADEMKRRGL